MEVFDMQVNRYWGLGAALMIVILAGVMLLGVFSGAFAQSGVRSVAAQATPGPTGPGGMMGQGGPTGQGGMMGQGGVTGPGGMMGQGGMMGGMGQGMMGGMGTMMGGPFVSTAKPISMTDAVNIANRSLQNLGNADLVFDEVEGYAYDFYVPVKEKSTGNYAFAWVIDRYSGSVMPEMGPNMMWNTKYGMMAGGMMGQGGVMGSGIQPGGQVTPTVDTPIGADQAKTLAQQFLDGFLPGTKVGDVDTFYGFRTIDVNRDGRQVGMISVNGYSGVVWYHTWHGDFLELWQRQTP